MFSLDFINTVAFGGLVLFAGHGIRRMLPRLARYNVPSPVVGGLLVAVVLTVARSQGVDLVSFDTRLQTPLMIAFFTTIGLGASLSLLKAGGPQVLVFLLICSALAVIQNVIGMAIAMPLGMHPLFGVLNGSVTLTGGPATGLAFAPAFEQAGVTGAATVAVAAAMFIAAICFWPVFQVMGRDYDAAVMGSGLCGFMLGTTANAMANMEALVDRYGPAPRAFLVVPIVGAFLIDFVNAVIITIGLNIWT